MSEDRQSAVEEMAKWMYDAQAPRNMPPFEEVPDRYRFQFLENANDLINRVLKAVTPIDPDVEMLRLRMEIVADEIANGGGFNGKVDAVKAADLIRCALDIDLYTDKTTEEDL